MDFIPIIKETKISSGSNGTENIHIRNIEFTYNSQSIFYNGIRLDAILYKTENTAYVEFTDPPSLCRTIGFRNFYILNQVYKFDPTITTKMTSTILFSKKEIEDLDILVDAMIDAYNGKIINNKSYYNNCY
jgi:hypothetical protein